MPRWPFRVCLPLIAPRLEGHGFLERQLSFVLQPVSEPCGLDLLAKVFAGFAAKLDLAQGTPCASCPASMIPRSGHEVIPVPKVVLLQRFVNLLRPVEILLVPPARDVEIGD